MPTRHGLKQVIPAVNRVVPAKETQSNNSIIAGRLYMQQELTQIAPTCHYSQQEGQYYAARLVGLIGLIVTLAMPLKFKQPSESRNYRRSRKYRL